MHHAAAYTLPNVIFILFVAIVTMLPSRGKGSNSSGEGGSETARASESTSELEQVLADWRAAGGKVDLSEIGADSESSTPGGENAADYHRYIMDRVRSISDEDRERLSEPWELSDLELNSAFKFYKDLIPQIKEAARISHCDWEIDFSKGFDTELPHLGYLRWSAVLLRADAILNARDGNVQQALDSIECGLLLSDQIGEEILPISALVSIAIESYMHEAIDRLFGDRPDASLARFTSLVESRDARSMYVQGVLNDVTVFLGEERRRRFGRDDVPLLQVDDGAFVDSVVEYLRTALAYAREAQKPFHEQGNVTIPKPPTSWSSAPRDIGGGHEMINHNIGVNATRRAIATFAIRLREMRRKSGEYPDPSTIETPIDRLDGGRITYERTPSGGFKLTSSATYGEAAEPIIWEWE